LDFVSLTPSWLRLEAHGEGEPCTGDSGSPALFGGSDVIAGILAIIPAGCGHEQIAWEQRLDTKSVRAFLSQYVTLP
jgi:hypothetical protein